MSPLDSAGIAKIKRFLLFHGPNAFKLDERVSSLVKAVIEPGAEAFDLDRFDGNQADVSNVINAASTPPVISPLRVVILANVDGLSASGLNRLDGLLPRIPPYSVLAMTAPKVDKRLKFFKKLVTENKDHAYFFDLPKQAEAAEMVIKFASDRGKKIQNLVALAVVETFGVDPYRLQNEVEKLCLFVGDKTEIEKSDLAFASGFTRVETAYDLPELLFSGNPRQALELARAASASGISEMQLLWILKNHFVRLNVAQVAGMGVSTLHHHFRVLTAMSPLQYQKQLRLQAARGRMLMDGLDAASAAFEVGYESASQFNREYSRFFGQPPMRDIRALRSPGARMLESVSAR